MIKSTPFSFSAFNGAKMLQYRVSVYRPDISQITAMISSALISLAPDELSQLDHLSYFGWPIAPNKTASLFKQLSMVSSGNGCLFLSIATAPIK
jgi:hypothetical protein